MQVVGVLFGVVTVQNSYLLYVKDVIVNKSFYSSRNVVTYLLLLFFQMPAILQLFGL